jgi:hypothetical protein
VPARGSMERGTTRDDRSGLVGWGSGWCADRLVRWPARSCSGCQVPWWVRRWVRWLSGWAGSIFGLNEGGWFVLLQSLKRRELQRAGYLPSDPAGFLVWAAGRGVLRQVGGGFQFRHLLLRDLLADEFEVLVIDLRETSATGRPVAVPRR